MSSTSINPESVQKWLDEQKGFERVINSVKVISVGDGDCLAELKIEKEHTNGYGILHGGLSATLIDIITTFGLCSHKSCLNVKHVSVDLNITFIQSGKLGEEVVIESKCQRVGRTLAFLNCEIKSKATGDLLVKGSNTKYIMRPKT